MKRRQEQTMDFLREHVNELNLGKWLTEYVLFSRLAKGPVTRDAYFLEQIRESSLSAFVTAPVDQEERAALLRASGLTGLFAIGELLPVVILTSHWSLSAPEPQQKAITAIPGMASIICYCPLPFIAWAWW